MLSSIDMFDCWLLLLFNVSEQLTVNSVHSSPLGRLDRVRQLSLFPIDLHLNAT